MKSEKYTEKELQNMHKPSNDFYTLLGVVVSKQKCAVKVVTTGEHCPETGIHQIDDTNEYLCEKCYENWTHSHNNA
jgi:hypothetical protein